MRGEFGYWVFEGDWQPAQRPSWNYRAEDGGGIVMDMFPHWNYLLENLFGSVRSVYARAVTHIPTRVDEAGAPYPATADDAAYAVFELDGGVIAQLNSSWAVRVDRKELLEFQVDGTHGSAVAGLFGCRIQPRNATPKPVWNPDLADTHDYDRDWMEVPDNDEFENGFKTQWEQFIRHVVEDAPHGYDLLAGARGRAAGRGRAGQLAHRQPDRTARARPTRVRRPDREPTAPEFAPAGPVARAVDTTGRAGPLGVVGTARLPPPRRAAAHPRRLRGRARGAAGGGGERARRAGRHRLGRHAGVPAPPLVVGTRRRRCDGHRPAQHGPGRRGDPRADLTERGRGALGRRRAGGRREHRPRADEVISLPR